MQPNDNAGGPSVQRTARNAKPNANQTGRSLSIVTVPLAMAVAVTAEANRIDAELRNHECRCPGRAYVRNAWELDRHKDGCRAVDAWLTVGEALAVLQTLPRRKLAALAAAFGGAT